MSGECIVVEVPADISELVPGFLDNRREDLARIAEALRTGDFPALRRLGHNMKGSGSAYGFDAISEQGARLERAALAGDCAAVSEAAASLETYLQRVTLRFGA